MARARTHLTAFVSGGRRGLDPKLAPDDLVARTPAEVRPLARVA